MQENFISLSPISVDKIIVFVMTLIVLFVLAFQALNLGQKFLAHQESRLLNDAVNSCAGAASVSYDTEDGARIAQPDQNWYEKCLQDKKIK